MATYEEEAALLYAACMKQYLDVSPDQIITLHDFPLHNEQVLKLYFRMYQQRCGKIVPPCPVLRKELVEPALKGKTKKAYDIFLQAHPNTKYFLLDGSHKSTAATLTRYPIGITVFEEEKDIQSMRELVSRGEVMSLTVRDTIRENIEELEGYFDELPVFQTVEEKTLRMVQERAIPEYMIEHFQSVMHG